MEIKQRKPLRLQEYDYSLPGGYFITICTKKRKALFWESPDAVVNDPSEVVLSSNGRIVFSAIQSITKKHPSVIVDHFSIMPNHVHLLLFLSGEKEAGKTAPNLSDIIRLLKRAVSKKVGTSIWQRSYYDHVIRNGKDYNAIVKYIYENPLCWKQVELY